MSRKFFKFVSVSCLVLLPYTAWGEEISVPPSFSPLPQYYKTIKVFDRDGSYVGRIITEKKFWTPISRIPQFLQNALVAVEDSRFYSHSGVDPIGIARAVVRNISKGKLSEGGSTITQQLIKNKYLSPEKTLDRKLKEASLSVDFENRYTKKQILEMYFNEIYYGHGQ